MSVLEFIGVSITSVWYFCGLVYAFCAEYSTYALHEPFIELSLALNILL